MVKIFCWCWLFLLIFLADIGKNILNICRDVSIWFLLKSNVTLAINLCISCIVMPCRYLFTRLLPRTDCTRCTSGTCRHFCRDRSRIPAELHSNTQRRTSRCRATKMPRFCRRCIRQARFRRPDSWGTDWFADRISRPF